MTKRIIGLGAEGVSAAFIELIERTNYCEVTSLLNDDESIKFDRFRQPAIVGFTGDLPSVVKRDGLQDFFVGLCSIGSREKKRELYEYAIKCGLKPHSVVHPKAIIWSSATMGRGHTVLAGAIIGPHVVLQENVTVNMGAMIEGYCMIRSHAQLAAGCWVGTGTTIGLCSYVGHGACVQPYLHIGEDVVIGAGAIVTEDVPDGEVVPGLQPNAAQDYRTKSKLVEATD